MLHIYIPNSHFSGVYYIKAPKTLVILVFNEPRAGAHMVMPRRKDEGLHLHVNQVRG